MKYFSEEERLKKERWLQTYPTFIQSIYNKMVGAHDCYYEELSPLISEKTVLLDAGCGKKGIMQLFKGRNAMTVGIDMQIDAIKRNAAMDCKVITDVIEKEFLRNNPIKYIDTYESEMDRNREESGDFENSKEVRERLRELGYID